MELVLIDMCKYNQTWFTMKYKIVSDLRQFLGMNTIKFIEEYVKKEEPVEEEKPAETQVEEPEESEVIPESEKAN